MPGEENIPQSEMWVFDVAAKSRTRIKADRFKDQTMSIATAPAASVRRDPRQPQQSFFLSDSPASCTHPFEPRYAQARRVRGRHRDR